MPRDQAFSLLLRTRGPLARTCAVAMLGAAPACVNDAGSRAFSVTDSAGVSVALSAVADHAFAEVEARPVVSLGGADVEGATLFSNIRDIHVDPAGNLWIADGASAEIRIFRPDGTHWKTAGTRGEGPGEFQRIRFLDGFHGDSVAVWDDATFRLTVLDPEGTIARMSNPARDQSPFQPLAMFDDGSMLVRERTILQIGQIAPEQTFADTAQFIRLDPETGTREPLATAPGPSWIWTGRYQINVPFTINPGFDVHDHALYVVGGPDFRVRIFRDGRLSESFGVERDPGAVTAEDMNAHRALFEALLPDNEQRREHLRALDHPDRPANLPAYYQVFVADDGATWARIYQPDLLAPALWDVHAPDRRWLGHVRTPAGFLVYVISQDRLVGVWRDELGVEHVRVYRYSRFD